MEFHRGNGKIVYDPFRGGMKNKTRGWCVVEVDREITRYFRWWMGYEKHIHLRQPSWDAHISVVRGERLQSDVQHLWKKYNGKRVDFLYQHVCEYSVGDDGDGGQFYIVEVECPLLNTIRDELKLRTGWKFHLTFGRTYEYEARRPKR